MNARAFSPADAPVWFQRPFQYPHNRPHLAGLADISCGSAAL